jgi:predicted RNA-binding protein with PIN domain
VPEPSLYLIDGYNLLHAAAFDGPEELVDALAGYVALRGARGVVVFDGVGEERTVGALAVRFAQPADALLERLAAERRSEERVLLVSSDRAVRDTAGLKVAQRSSEAFAGELTRTQASERTVPRASPSKIEDALDEETRNRLEHWRRERP